MLVTATEKGKTFNVKFSVKSSCSDRVFYVADADIESNL